MRSRMQPFTLTPPPPPPPPADTYSCTTLTEIIEEILRGERRPDDEQVCLVDSIDCLDCPTPHHNLCLFYLSVNVVTAN